MDDKSPRESTDAGDNPEKRLKEMECGECIAHFSFDDAGEAGASCAFCGGTSCVEVPDEQSAYLSKTRDEYVVKAVVDKDGAREIFKKWLGKGLFRPKDIGQAVKQDKMQMTYLPYWVFEGKVFSDWHGEYSKTRYRWVTKTRTVMKNGKHVQETYQAQESYKVWYPESGTHEGAYSESVVACDVLSEDENKKLLRTFDNIDKQEYEPLTCTMLEGWNAAIPGLTEEDASGIASRNVAEMAEKACRGMTQRLLGCKNNVNVTGVWLVYIPAWILPYRYKKKKYRAIANARTQDIFGKKPLGCAYLSCTGMVVVMIILMLAVAASIIFLG